METDKITLNDLSIFHTEEESSVFQKLNHTLTTNGKIQLQKNLQTPLSSIEQIEGIQRSIQKIEAALPQWPMQISNGTIMVVEQFYESAVDPIPAKPTRFSAWSYRYLHAPDFSLVKYSTGHFFDLIKGMKNMVALLKEDNNPKPLANLLLIAEEILLHDSIKNIIPGSTYAADKVLIVLRYAYFFRHKFKRQVFQLIQVYAQLDAWYAMAKSKQRYALSFPHFIETDEPFLAVNGLYHLLLEHPVSYDLTLDNNSNFVFLTGANMAGKSTFIKSVGVAVYLAHVGMPVPAKNFRLGLLDGLLSNINVMDNLVKGESYFYNEVQRIKSTITRINNGKKWLILIDELFKGTNVQDAMKCSVSVIEGFLKMHHSIFILSTHLYEISESLKQYPNIAFHYFETTIQNEQLTFNYQLKPGISNDRLGYLILKQEGVVKMLADL